MEVGFVGPFVWPVGNIPLPFTLEHYMGKERETVLIKFLITKSPSPYNMLLGSMGLWNLQAVPSTVHGLLKFPFDEGIIIVQSTTLNPPKYCQAIQHDIAKPYAEDRGSSINTKEVVINEKHEDQNVKIGFDLPKALQKGLIVLLK